MRKYGKGTSWVFHECEIEMKAFYKKLLKLRCINNFNIPIVANSIKELYDSTKAIVVIAVND